MMVFDAYHVCMYVCMYRYVRMPCHFFCVRACSLYVRMPGWQDDLRQKSKQWKHAGMGVPLFDAHDPIWNTISKDAKSFIQSLMAIKPGQRPTAAQALDFPWIQRHTNPSFVRWVVAIEWVGG